MSTTGPGLWQRQVMGVINVTPDSFSDGGKHFSKNKALASALEMIEAGASIIDIGGESTRPGADPVSVDEELARVIPVIESLKAYCSVHISIDTKKTVVMSAAIEAGATMVNDVWALQDEGAIDCVARADVPVCLMHMQGMPDSMQDNPSYQHVVTEVLTFLKQRKEACIAGGIKPKNIIVDPGFGFGKTLDHNLALLNCLSDFAVLESPVLVGVSKKTMFGQILGGLPPAERGPASLAGAVIAWLNGAHIIRTHDVPETLQALSVVNAVRGLSVTGGN